MYRSRPTTVFCQLACLLLVMPPCPALNGQVITARQRYVVHVPERLSVQFSSPTVRSNGGETRIRQSIEVQTQPAEGVVLAISLQSEPNAVSRIQQISSTDTLAHQKLQLEPGLIHLFDFPARQQHSAMLWSSQPEPPSSFRRFPTGNSELTLDLHFEMLTRPNVPTETIVTTFTSAP